MWETYITSAVEFNQFLGLLFGVIKYFAWTQAFTHHHLLPHSLASPSEILNPVINNSLLIPDCSQATGNHDSVFYLGEFGYSRYLIRLIT